MTSKDKDQFDDEFEAFLHGRDDLSRHLRSLPQPEPSAELDAAILARVEAELARSSAASAAANDPVIPGTPKHPPSFLTRWRVPIGLAASVVLTCLVVLRWQTQADNPSPMVVAQAPQEAPQAAAAPESKVAMADQAQQSLRQAAPAAKNKAEGMDAAKRSDSLDGKQLAARSAEKAERKAAKSSPASQPDMQIADASGKTDDAAAFYNRSKEQPKALAKEAAKPQVPSSDMQIADASAARRNESSEKTAGSSGVAIGGALSAGSNHDKPAASRAASEPSLQIAQSETQETRARATPAPTPATAPAPMMESRVAATPAPATPAPAAIAPAPAQNPEKAKAWLALIDELLKADLRQDALAEWEKFRKAYPQYPVPEKTEARIKALKK